MIKINVLGWCLIDDIIVFLSAGSFTAIDNGSTPHYVLGKELLHSPPINEINKFLEKDFLTGKGKTKGNGFPIKTMNPNETISALMYNIVWNMGVSNLW